MFKMKTINCIIIAIQFIEQRSQNMIKKEIIPNKHFGQNVG